MNAWLLVAVLGGVVALAGLMAVFRRYGRGEVSGRYVAAIMVGLAGFGGFALLEVLRPELARGAPALAFLLPGCAAVVVVIREFERARAAGTGSSTPREP